MSNVSSPASAGKVIDPSTREILKAITGTLNLLMEQLDELLPSQEEADEEAAEPPRVSLDLSHLAMSTLVSERSDLTKSRVRDRAPSSSPS
jgi:hypothetical protein